MGQRHPENRRIAIVWKVGRAQFCSRSHLGNRPYINHVNENLFTIMRSV